MKSQSFSDYYTDILLCIIGLPMAVVTLYGCIVLWQSTLDIKQVSIPGICNIKNITSSTYCEKALLFWQEEIPSECIGIKFSPVAIYSCNNGFDEDITPCHIIKNGCILQRGQLDTSTNNLIYLSIVAYLIVFLVMVGISLFLPVKRCVKYVFERKNKYIQLENKA